jgi:hypothetical protein
MTIPYERTRAVLRTRELLKKLAAGENLDADTLQRFAASLLKHFPDEHHLVLSARALPDTWSAPDATWLGE